MPLLTASNNHKWEIKICSCCGIVWTTRADFRRGTVFVAVWKETGLVLYNCKCKSTITLELYKGSKERAIKLRRLQNDKNTCIKHIETNSSIDSRGFDRDIIKGTSTGNSNTTKTRETN